MIVLGTKPSHDAAKILHMLMSRLSIPRSDWVLARCFAGRKKDLSSKKAERLKQMANDIISLDVLLELNRPCVVVGMGKLPCEVLVNASLLSTRAGSCWRCRFGGKAWITYSPDASLFDPGLVVDMSAVLAKAAEWAKIETKFNRNTILFDWTDYERRKQIAREII